MKYSLLLLLFITSFLKLNAQTTDTTENINEYIDSFYIEEIENKKDYLDSIYIEQIENKKGEPIKVLHAEPLYIDLIRDLGARKGEREWNVGIGLNDRKLYNEYIALVEYEWAPINRLGLEVELPFSYFQRLRQEEDSNTIFVPGNNLNSLKVAAQYSFWVSDKYKTSMALGYIHEFELVDFKSYSRERIYSGNIYNPFFIAAKRWGQNYHTLLYAGPEFIQHFKSNSFHTSWQINSNFHYMIDGTRNFIGVEFNKDVSVEGFEMTIRPQMRVGIADNLLIGIVTGIPVNRPNERMSTFLRLIYEPGHTL